MDCLIGGLAGVAAGLFSNPFDVIKTRMQLQGELKRRGKHAIHYKNILHASYTIVKTDGLLALQKGIIPALWFQLVVNGTRLGIYQTFDNSGLIRSKDGNTAVANGIFYGAVAGAAGAFFGSPFLLIKTQLMSNSHTSIAVGYQHTHKSTSKALLQIYNKHGIKGLWRGSISSMMRNALGSSSQIVTFSRAKEILNENGLLINRPYIQAFVASILGGLVKTIVMTPLDVIVTRLYNQGTDIRGKGLYYNGLIDCAQKIARLEGMLGFYKGFGPSFLRQGPHSILLLVFWDIFKDIEKDFKNKNSI